MVIGGVGLYGMVYCCKWYPDIYVQFWLDEYY